MQIIKTWERSASVVANTYTLPPSANRNRLRSSATVRGKLRTAMLACAMPDSACRSARLFMGDTDTTLKPRPGNRGTGWAQLFYDTGSGFSPRECLVATEDVYNELTHEVSVTFILPEDARAVRLDPGELAC